MADLWDDMSVQFPRLIAEMMASGYFNTDNEELEARMMELCENTDLDPEDIMYLVDTAQAAWEIIKLNLVPDSHIAAQETAD